MTAPQPIKPIVVFGCGGHARVIADILCSTGVMPAGFLDDYPPAPVIDGIPVIGDRHRLNDRSFLDAHAVIPGIGDCALRRHIATYVLHRGGTLAIAIHPRAVIAQHVNIGDGTVVMAGAVINTGSRLGRFVVVNTGAILDHDTMLEDGVHISPGCHLAGNVTCGSDAFVGTGANIIPRVRIGARSVVAAGAAVTADVPPDVMVAGCPAIVKKRYSPSL